MITMITIIITYCLGLTVLVANVAGNVKGCNTTAEGLTWTFDLNVDVQIPGVETVHKCNHKCERDADCLGYTWTYGDVINNCYLFKELGQMSSCDNCISGVVPEKIDGTCIGGVDDILDTKNADSATDCSKFCTGTIGCNAYTYWDENSPFPHVCFLYGSCEDQLPCEGCASGQINCISPPLPKQCTEYMILDEADRSTSNSDISNCFNEDLYMYEDCQCDGEQWGGLGETSIKWEGPGYYRFMKPAGTMMPEVSPGSRHYCGTAMPGWLGSQHPQKNGKEVVTWACFDYGNFGDCHEKRNVTVTLCDDYYVYYLIDTPYCQERYCAEN